LKFDSLQSKLNQIWLLTDDQQTIKKSRMNNLIIDLDAINNDLDLITPRGVYDEYYITIYKLLIKEITYGYLEPGDYDVLNEIAQDYSDNSMANVTAFESFNLCSPDPYPNYSLKCEEEPRVEESNQNLTNLTMADITVSRISVNEVSFSSESPLSGKLTIYDLAGRLVYLNNIRIGSYSVNLKLETGPGIYYYRITSDDYQSIYNSGLIPIIK